MAIREKRHIHRSLMTPGSRKFWNLRQDRSRIVYLGLILNADDTGILEGAAEDVLALFPRSKWKLAQVREYLKDIKAQGLIRQFDKAGAKYIEILEFVTKQDWHGVSRDIPSDPAAIAADGGRNSRNGLPQKIAAIAAMPQKSHVVGSSSSSYITKNQLPLQTNSEPTNDQDADSAFLRAKKRYRDYVGKSFGTLASRRADWARFVKDNGADRAVEAVEKWAREGGRGFRDFRYPLAVFLSDKDERIADLDQVSNDPEEGYEDLPPGVSPPPSLEESARGADAWIERQRQETIKELADKKKREDEEAKQWGFAPNEKAAGDA